MRNTFINNLVKHAKSNDKIFLLVGDLGYSVVEPFETEFPDRFINVGVAEQSMIGICAGLATQGMRPFAYTIAAFCLYRPFEMVKTDLCYQNLPVTIVGMGSGLVVNESDPSKL